MQKLPDYKEIISSNPPVVLHHLASILHCLSYLFPRLHLFTRFVLLQLPLKYIYFSSLSNSEATLPPYAPHHHHPPPPFVVQESTFPNLLCNAGWVS